VFQFEMSGAIRVMNRASSIAVLWDLMLSAPCTLLRQNLPPQPSGSTRSTGSTERPAGCLLIVMSVSLIIQ
jgi:hypothetical protein